MEDLAIGDPVVAVVEGGFRTHIIAPAELVVRLPRGLDFEQAATVPSAFVTARYALHDVGGGLVGRLVVAAAAGEEGGREDQEQRASHVMSPCGPICIR